MAADTNLKEVITIQVGNYSNFVGANFWNLQEALHRDSNVVGGCCELNQDILYREGQDLIGKRTYKPRVICFDFKGNVSPFLECDRSSDSLGNVGTSAWEGKVERYDRRSEPRTFKKDLRELISSNQEHVDSIISSSLRQFVSTPFNTTGNVSSRFRSLEEEVTSWSDYSLAYFHPRSLHLIKSSDNDEEKTFSNFGCGLRLFESRKFQDDFEDQLHFFAEECDRLQGFQIFADIHDGFGGLTSGILQELGEEYAKKSHLSFATMPAAFPDDTRESADQRILNIMLGFARYADNSSQIVPLCLRSSMGLKNTSVLLPWINYKETVSYHTSAILATAIDTATLPYRLTDSHAIDMNTLTESISTGGRKISVMSVGMPVPVSSTFTMKELLKGAKDLASNFTSLTPHVAIPGKVLSQTAVVRGLPSHLLEKSDHPETALQCSGILQSGTKQYHSGSCFSHIVQQPCMVAPPFPDIFKPSVTPVGCVVTNYHRPEELGVQKTSAMTNLQNCEEVSNLLEALVVGTRQANIKKYPGFLETGIELDDIKSSLEYLESMAQSYYLHYEL